MSCTTGTHLGPYEILQPIGAGGMGRVCKARDTGLNRTVAIKVLSPEFASRPDWKQRFEREAQAIASLNHPHICTRPVTLLLENHPLRLIRAVDEIRRLFRDQGAANKKSPAAFAGQAQVADARTGTDRTSR